MMKILKLPSGVGTSGKWIAWKSQCELGDRSTDCARAVAGGVTGTLCVVAVLGFVLQPGEKWNSLEGAWSAKAHLLLASNCHCQFSGPDLSGCESESKGNVF